MIVKTLPMLHLQLYYRATHFIRLVVLAGVLICQPGQHGIF